MNNIYQNYAKLLLHYSIGLKKGHKLMIYATYLAEPLLKELYKEALLIGAYPEVDISINGTDKILYDYANKDQLEYISPLYEYVMHHYDAILNIRAPFNTRELESIDAEKKKQHNMVLKDIRTVFRKRSAENQLLWSLCVFPTDSAAQECGMAKNEYEDFVFSACYLDKDDPIAEWEKVSKSQQRIIDLLNTKDKICYKAGNIDVSFSVKNRQWINSDGRRNMPSGEVYTSPIENSVNGFIQFSFPGIYLGQEIEDIRLEINEGQVVKWSAKKGQNLLDQIIQIPGANYFGEVAIGTNQQITKFTKNMLFDEKIGGTVHMALGSSFIEAGGKNESAIHWDLLADMRNDGEIFADGELIYKHGKFII